MGILVKPQDLLPPVHVEAMSPSFLVAKKPKGHRMVTSFGHIAAHAKNPPVPMDSIDTVLRNLSTWKYLICADIKSAYHQIPLS